MRKIEKINLILNYLEEILPNAKCELNYNNDYELLIAVMLSAQTTDKKVNAITPILFGKYKSLEELSLADVKDIEKIIHSIGLYKNKAKNVVLIAKDLLNKFDGKVPFEYEDLTSLSGVGRKTSNVIRAELFNIPAIAVDTHVERISKRLLLAEIDDSPYQVEMKLEKTFPKRLHIKIHHQFIHFGRYYCLARNPKCETCKLKDICSHFKLK